jgi:3-oxoacyl-[acyl-carrier-protein] synthase-3
MLKFVNERYTKIVGTGSYIPERIITNEYFQKHDFFDPSTKKKFRKTNQEIIQKFEEITNISERRWVADNQQASDIAALAVVDACKSSGIDHESLDFIIVGHNFGNVRHGSFNCNVLPGLASKVKAILQINNPSCICHDIVAGCPGWTQGMIVADAYLKSGIYHCGIVVGADVLSRVSDPHDRDSMIYADGAGATIVKVVESNEPIGVIAHASRSDAAYANMLTLGPSHNPAYSQDDVFIKMLGHKLYLYAIQHVPPVIKESLEKAGLQLKDVSKVLIHQANEKMDEGILKGVCQLYDKNEAPEGIMPMTIRKLGNSSTATVPTLLDMIVKGKLEGHQIKKEDYIILASVGAGMNINSIVYKW